MKTDKFEPKGYELKLIIKVPDGHWDDFGDPKCDLMIKLLRMGDVKFEEYIRTKEEPEWTLQETTESFRAVIEGD